MREFTLTWLRGHTRVLCVGIFAGLLHLSFPLFSQDQASDDTGEDVVELERLAVTGSRIKRVDIETALPVTVIDREMIDRSGKQSLPDLLRSLSFNSFGSYRSSFSGESGTSEINLRGLGSGRSLVLIDGHRLPKSPSNTYAQNLNTIPLGQVERIEILSDGASAIYGSDAIGGVINIITRDDYSGWELMYGRADPHWGSGKRDQGSIMYGWAGKKSNLLISFSFNDKEISYNRDFPDFEPGESFFANNFDITDPEFGFPYFAITAIPGGCSDSEAFFLVPDEYSLSGELCLYDYARLMAGETSEDTYGLLIKYEYEINSRWSFWANASGSESSAFGQFAPQPYWSLWDNLPLTVNSPNNPTNPASPMYDPSFGPNVPVHWIHRFESLGTRDSDVETQLIDAQAGISGWIGNVELDFGLRRTWNSSDRLFQNALLFEPMYQLIEDGSYNLQNPVSTPDDIRDRMKTDYKTDWELDQDEVFASINWDLFKTSAGPVQWVLGGEYRREHYRSETTWPGDQPLVSTDRNTTSLFFETLVPVTESLELSLAGRYDDYSDWGNEFSPKVSLRWRVNDTLVTRASWGEGFRAPQLNINTIESVGYIDYTDEDVLSCEAIGREPGCVIVFQAYFTVSETLGAETSEQYSLGLVWDPSDWLSLTIDYYDITIENEIDIFGWYHILNLDWLGLPPPAGLGVTRDPSGLLQSITHGWGNYGLVETSGIDLNTKLKFDLGPGRWRSDLQLSWASDYSFQINGEQGPDIVGTPGYPEIRGVLSNYYDIGDFSFSWNINYISGQSALDVEGFEAVDDVPSWVTHDVQATWFAPWNGRITLGAQNVFSKEPTSHVGKPANGYNYDFTLYDYYGRVLYLNYTQTFN